MTRPRAPAEERAAELQRQARAANEDMRPTRAAVLLDRALAVLGTAPATGSTEALRGRILVTLAITEAELGDAQRGLDLLDEAARLLTGGDRAVLHAQRAILLRRSGRDAEALPQYESALRLLDARESPVLVARVLLNRAVLHTAAGRLTLARSDLVHCLELATSVGEDALEAKAGHNLGYLEWVAGDLPGALRQYELVEARYREVLPGNLSMLSLDRARVLLAAGLLAEAEGELAEAVPGLRDQRSGQDYAEGLLARAEVALLAGRPGDAARFAKQAERVFARRGNRRWAGRAALLGIQAAQARRGSDSALVRRADAVHARLVSGALPADAQLAALVAARAHLAGGDPDTCRRLLAETGRLGSGDARVYALLVRSELAAGEGRKGDAQRYRKDVLAELGALRGSLGALDLRAGTAALGTGVTQAGLEAALAAGRASEVFNWAELTRAQSLLMPPVRPETDDPDLQRLRAVTLAHLRASLDGTDQVELRTERDRLRRLVQRRTWLTSGEGGRGGIVRLAEVRRVLGDGALVTYLRAGKELHALAVTKRRSALVPLGPLDPVRERLLRLRSDLDVIAGRDVSDPLHGTLLRVLTADAAALSAQLLDPVMPLLEDRDLVVVPTADLITVPWGVLPAAKGRSVTVTPSATLWAGRRAARPAVPRALLLAAGPRVPHARHELDAIAALAEGSGVAATRQLEPTAAGVLGVMNHHDLVHLACHGHHVTDNPLFSGLEFSDGLLMGYDLLGLEAPPRTVVLSACDLGMADARPGDESLGVSSALLAAGTATVVASVTRTGDSTTAAVMSRLYSRLLAGTPVPAALAEAVADEPSGFICLGAG